MAMRNFKQTTPELKLPLGYVYALIPLGGVLAFVYQLEELLALIRNHREKVNDAIIEEGGHINDNCRCSTHFRSVGTADHWNSNRGCTWCGFHVCNPVYPENF